MLSDSEEVGHFHTVPSKNTYNVCDRIYKIYCNFKSINGLVAVSFVDYITVVVIQIHDNGLEKC